MRYSQRGENNLNEVTIYYRLSGSIVAKKQVIDESDALDAIRSLCAGGYVITRIEIKEKQ
jgi:hypothetical protein